MNKNSSSKFLEGLAYDDVLLRPSYSEVLPSQVDISSKFSKNINLKVPIISAAMDTVSESALAISIAREGGIAVIHKNLSIEEQAKEVILVKRAESGMILDPITLLNNSKVVDAKKIMSEFKIGGIPILNSKSKLVGIVTNRDLRFVKDNNLCINEIMTSNLVTTSDNTTLAQAEDILKKHKIEKLPVVDLQNNLIGLFTYRDITKVKINPNSNKDSLGRLRVAAAIGVTDNVNERVSALVEAGVDAVVLDTAHAHSSRVINVLNLIKNKYLNLDVVVGNIATVEAAKFLIDAGADSIKVGIGPGSICTTRVVAGVGVPQFSAILDIASKFKNSNVPIIADGGIRYSGDIVKAIAAGADSVMLGSLLAGTEESPGETIIYEGRKYKTYRGMGSIDAMKSGSKDRYFQENEKKTSKLVPEGTVGRVDYKGKLSEVIFQYVGGLKAGMGYVGAKNIENLKNNSTFVKITSSGIIESHPHNVTITREAPNYSRK